MRSERIAARRAVVLVILAVLPFSGCAVVKGVGKVTVGVAKGVGKVVTYPFKAMGKKNGSKDATAPIVGSAGASAEKGTVIVGANSSEDAKTTKAVATATSSTGSATKSYGGSEIYIDGIPIDSPSIMASQPGSSSMR